MGEPFRAEIDLLSYPDDSATLTPRLASPGIYPLTGFRYNPALTGTRLSIRAQSKDRRVIELVSERPLNEPFVYLLVELESNATRIVRGYTALLDPPGYRSAPAAAEYLPAAVPAAAPAEKTAVVTAPATGHGKPAARPAPRPGRLSDADAKTLAAMLERVATLEAAVAKLQQQWEKPVVAAALQPAPPPVATKSAPVAAPSPAPVTRDKPAVPVESAPRHASGQDSLLNNALLFLAIGLLVIVAWLAWVVWGPPSKQAKLQGKG